MKTLPHDSDQDVSISDMSDDDLLALIDSEARRDFNMTGDEFAQAWHNGSFDNVDDPRISNLAILLP